MSDPEPLGVMLTNLGKSLYAIELSLDKIKRKAKEDHEEVVSGLTLILTFAIAGAVGFCWRAMRVG
jgi:hypothetical protein